MNTKEFYALMELLTGKNIYGQIFTVLNKTDSGLTAMAKKAGYLKISFFQARIHKVDNAIELINTSTGMSEAGLTYEGKRESYYNHEAYNGFLCNLKSNPDKKYIEIRFNEADEKFKSKTLYVNPNGDIITEQTEIDKICTGKKKLGLAYEISGVKIRQFAWENIIYMSVAGIKMENESLIAIKNYFDLK